MQDISQLDGFVVYDVLSENRKEVYTSMDKNKQLEYSLESKFKKIIFKNYGIKYVPITYPFTLKKAEILEHLN